jgi:hypothetical protein
LIAVFAEHQHRGSMHPMKAGMLIAGAVILPLAGCTAVSSGGRPARVSEPMLTCSAATNAAREAIVRMGYTLTDVQTARADTPGRIVGTKDSGWSPADPQGGTVNTVTVTIRCTDAGSEFEAVTDEGFTTQIGFPQRFASTLKAEVAQKRVRPTLDQEEQRGLAITVEPLRGTTAQQEFGTDLPAAGVTPVKVAINNRSRQRYDFRRSEVELMTVQGGRESALPVSAVTSSVGTARDAAVIQQNIREKELHDGEIAPGATLSGYLYFKAAAYRRARVVLTDIENDEPEGFSVEF